jgi:glutaredoxin 3
MARVLMYCTATCPYCIAAESLLSSKGVRAIDKVRVDLEPQRRAEMARKTGRTSVPQIWIGDTYVGGCDDLHALDGAGKLDPLLAQA